MCPAKKALPQKWQKTDKSLKAIQVAFDLDVKIQTAIRMEAVHKGLSPSDMIRDMLSLPVSTAPKRPRLTTSLNDNDYKMLADRFNLSPEDKLTIKKMAMDELIRYVSQQYPDNEQPE